MKNYPLLITTGLLLVAACQSKRVLAMVNAEPGDAQLSAVNTKVPSTMEQLKKGHAIFMGACTKCHHVKDVTGFSEAKLQKVITTMSSKAKLSPEDQDAVWKYALGLNLTNKK